MPKTSRVTDSVKTDSVSAAVAASTVSDQPGGASASIRQGVPATASARALWAALPAHPGATTAELAEAAKIGRSTAGKLLDLLDERGLVIRIPGGLRQGGRVIPTRWELALPEAADLDAEIPVAPAEQEAGDQDQPSAPSGHYRSDLAIPALPPGVAPTPALGAVWRALRAQPGLTPNLLAQVAGTSRQETEDALSILDGARQARRTRGKNGFPDRWDPVGLDKPEGDDLDALIEERAKANPDFPDMVDAAAEARRGTQGETAEADKPEPRAEEPSPAPAPTEGGADPNLPRKVDTAAEIQAEDAEATSDQQTPDAGDAKASLSEGRSENRLRPGQLRGMVVEYLSQHPEEEFSPTALSKALAGRSSGAISNTMEKIVADGLAVQTCEKPRMYRWAGSTA